jgi:hypothetical protein
MNKNLKVVLSAAALAALMATPVVAKPRSTQPHQAAPTQVHRSGAVVRDYVTGEVLGSDPDPRVRYELKRDGGSSWDEGKE